jgi:hypothetical protein
MRRRKRRFVGAGTFSSPFLSLSQPGLHCYSSRYRLSCSLPPYNTPSSASPFRRNLNTFTWPPSSRRPAVEGGSGRTAADDQSVVSEQGDWQFRASSSRSSSFCPLLTTSRRRKRPVRCLNSTSNSGCIHYLCFEGAPERTHQSGSRKVEGKRESGAALSTARPPTLRLLSAHLCASEACGVRLFLASLPLPDGSPPSLPSLLSAAFSQGSTRPLVLHRRKQDSSNAALFPECDSLSK